MSSLESSTSKFISVTEASQISGLTTSFIRRLLRTGQIEGVKIGYSWLTTEEAIREYLSKERRRGPKPAHD
jgi:excisionase family DNA binding protein